MYTITINIPDEKAIPLRDLFCEILNYPDQIEDENGDLQPNPVSRNQFPEYIARQEFKRLVKKLQALKRNKELEAIGENDYEVS